MDSKAIYISPNYDEYRYKFKSERYWRADGKYEPFVYIIQEVETEMMYIGSHTRKNCLGSHLGTKYFTSSKEFNWKSDTSLFEICKIIPCVSNHDALVLEYILIEQNGAVWDEWYYNKHHPYIGFNGCGAKSAATKEKMSKSAKKRSKQRSDFMKELWADENYRERNLANRPKTVWTEERRKEQSIRFSGENNPNYGLTGELSHNYGRIKTEEEKIKISNRVKNFYQNNDNPNKGRKHSEEAKRKISEKAKQRDPKTRLHSKETKKKMSESAKNRKPIECPYCGKVGDTRNMKRWHFENCKKKWD